MAGNSLFSLLTAALLSIAAAACDGKALHGGERETLGLFSTLPIYWGEGEEFADLLDKDRPKGWVREALEGEFTLVPLDATEADNLKGLTHLILAQPRPLAPSENAALDEWVRGGGQLLLFADPMLTQHSDYPLGDRRRPQDMVLLSPILAHWGLDLHFDDSQQSGERLEQVEGLDIPVNLSGRFVLAGDGGEKPCAVARGGLIARCALGKGRALLVADAALLDSGDEASSASFQRKAALDELLSMAFDD